MSRVFLIDTDTASDDAVALIMAIHAPDVRVAAITTVAGNVDVDQATRNALYTVELCGSDIPVYSGADKVSLSFSYTEDGECLATRRAWPPILGSSRASCTKTGKCPLK